MVGVPVAIEHRAIYERLNELGIYSKLRRDALFRLITLIDGRVNSIKASQLASKPRGRQ